jgi:hypothetical protein
MGYLARTAIAVIFAIFASCQQASAQDMLARSWMQFEPTSRAIYVRGVMDGIDLTVKYLGFELRATTDRGITYQEMSEIVYRKLLREPELRSGSIQEVIANTLLGEHVTLTDRQGQPIQSKTGR